MGIRQEGMMTKPQEPEDPVNCHWAGPTISTCVSQVVSISKHQAPNQTGGSMVVMPTQRIRRATALQKGGERERMEDPCSILSRYYEWSGIIMIFWDNCDTYETEMDYDFLGVPF